MIQNDHQLQVTRDAIAKLKKHLEEDKVNPPPADIIPLFKNLIGIQTQALIDELENEIKEYLNRPKNGINNK